jgi:hypothetical protein
VHRSFQENFRVPTDPLVSLIMQPGEGRFVSRSTIEAANIALWRMGQFNQIVQEQTDSPQPTVRGGRLNVHAHLYVDGKEVKNVVVKQVKAQAART